jgi:hypothetical protein
MKTHVLSPMTATLFFVVMDAWSLFRLFGSIP